MNKRIVQFVAVLVCVCGLPYGFLRAEDKDTVEALKKKIEALEARVQELEAQDQGAGAMQGFSKRTARSWDPFEQINQMQRDMDRLFQESFGQPGARQGIFTSNMSFVPDYQINETEKGYELKFDLTGVNQDKLDVQIKEHSITIKAEASHEVERQGSNQMFSSRSFGTVVKTIPVPDDADSAKAITQKKDNWLVIQMPKKSNRIK